MIAIMPSIQSVPRAVCRLSPFSHVVWLTPSYYNEFILRTQVFYLKSVLMLYQSLYFFR